MTDASRSALDRRLRDLAPRVLGAVVRRFGDFAAAEDAVQEALLAAAAAWPTDGVPRNPGGWLFRVAARRMHDRRDDERARRRRERAAAVREEVVDAGLADVDADADADDTLVLLFLCCHPSLTPGSAIALTLRAVGGLSTAEIAAAFLVSETTMAQRISRAKQTILDSQVPFRMPEPGDRAARLRAVMHVLYLIFNEGYASSAGPQVTRVELATEAMALTRELHRRQPDEPEVAGLLALMLLTDARRAARTSASGALIPLTEQDRSLWDRDAIAEGTALVTAAFARGRVGEYQVQAAIAALHDAAPHADATDWAQIHALYGWLLQATDNPIVALNHAVAEAMVHGPAAGLARLATLESDARLAGNHRLDAVRAHLHERAGDHEAAVVSYRAAAARTRSEPERAYLTAKADRLDPARDTP